MVVGQGKVGVKLENDEAGEVGLRQSGSPARSLRAGSVVTVGSAGNYAGNGAVKEKRDRRSSSKEGVEGVEGMGAGVGVPTVVMGKEREGSAGSGEWVVSVSPLWISWASLFVVSSSGRAGDASF